MEPNFTRWLPLQWLFLRLIHLLIKCTSQLDIDGLDNVPPNGAFVVAVNHLHLIDTLLGIGILPRRAVPFVNAKWKRTPVRLILAPLGGAIYSGKSDAHAFRQALIVLRSGGVLGIAPEGTRSRTGQLSSGKPGVVRLAMEARVPILPMVMSGQERATTYWKRLRRAPIRVRIGKLIDLPANIATKDEIASWVIYVMVNLARLLPREYRGEYTSSVDELIDNLRPPEIESR